MRKQIGNAYTVEMSQYSQPIVKESRTDEWVMINIEKDDGTGTQRYFDYLIDRYRNSTTNNAILNNITKLIYGNGLTARDAARKANDYARLKMMFPKNDLKAVITDYAILGTGAFQVIVEKGEIKYAKHIQRNLLEPEKCNEDGEIEAYYFCDDWKKTREYTPKRIELLKANPSNGVYLVVFGDYAIGRKYVFKVDYEGALDYALLEERIAEYQINDANNGFTPTTIINYNNGITDQEQQRLIVRKTEDNTTGVNGKRTLISFNSNKESEVTVQQLPLNDAPAHYEYLSNECRDKLLAAHNVVSSMLVGIAKDGQGFASTADEIEISSQYFYATSINHKQETVIDAIDSITMLAGFSLDLRFERKKLVDMPQEPQTTLSMSENDEELSKLLTDKADTLGEEWVLVDSRKVDYDLEDTLDAGIEELNNEKETVLAKLARIVTTGTARPNAKSEQDNVKFKTRYRYNGEIKQNSRLFCQKMMTANKVYRKEDIIKMGETIVNQGWGAEGADKYDIWLYKGGGDCGHYWVRETYARMSDVNNPNAELFTPAQQRKAGFIAPVNDKKVYQKPKDMKNRGFLKPRG